MSVTAQDIADVMNELGVTKDGLAGMMRRLAPLDQLNRLTAARALMVAEHNAARATMDAELGELDTQIAQARAAADLVAGGGA